MLLNKNVREKKNRFLDFIARHVMSLFRKCHAHAKTTLAFAAIVILVGLGAFPRLGTEFLPQLNEGAIYIRATLPSSISLEESVRLASQIRRKLLAYPEVRQVMSQSGRPNDGTDATGFFQQRVPCGHLSGKTVEEQADQSPADRKDATGSLYLSGGGFQFFPNRSPTMWKRLLRESRGQLP